MERSRQFATLPPAAQPPDCGGSLPKTERDYYEILGVRRDADQATIQAAFRSLARECHPDVSDAPEAAERFRELARAYTVLSKRPDRLLYDRFGYRGRGNGGFADAGSFLDDELFDLSRLRRRRGADVTVQVEVDEYESRRGTTKDVRVEREQQCRTCSGGGKDPAVPVRTCPACGGNGRRREVSEAPGHRLLRLQECDRCGGSGQLASDCADCDGAGRMKAATMLRVEIPAGLSDREAVRLRGEGDAGTAGGEAGDAVVLVRVRSLPDRPLVRAAALLLLVVALVCLYVILR